MHADLFACACRIPPRRGGMHALREGHPAARGRASGVRGAAAGTADTLIILNSYGSDKELLAKGQIYVKILPKECIINGQKREKRKRGSVL